MKTLKASMISVAVRRMHIRRFSLFLFLSLSLSLCLLFSFTLIHCTTMFHSLVHAYIRKRSPSLPSIEKTERELWG